MDLREMHSAILGRYCDGTEESGRAAGVAAMRIVCTVFLFMVYYDFIAIIMDILADLPIEHTVIHLWGILFGSFCLWHLRVDTIHLWQTVKRFLS
jgi:hypothetical protein